MAKKIQAKYTSRKQLDEKLSHHSKRQSPIDLNKYFGKINFGMDGLAYQLQVRKEWPK